MAPVDETRELYTGRPAVFEERLDRRADRAARVEDVVDEDARQPFERELEPRRLDDGLRADGNDAASHPDVVAMEGDVDAAERNLNVGEVGDQAAKTVRERDAARVDADERRAVEVGIALDDLVRDARERAAKRVGIEENLSAAALFGLEDDGFGTGAATSNSFPASRDRVKGAAGD